MRTARIDRLLAVQALDIDLARVEERRDHIPARRAEVTREITTLETERDDRSAALEQGHRTRRGKESEVETLKDRLAKYERQLNDVKTNVAYSALLSEIQRTKREIVQLEDEILDLLSEQEDHERRVTELDAGLVEKRTAATGALEDLQREQREVESQIEAMRHRRDLLAREIEPAVYRMYDRLRRARRFPALVELRGRACGSCHGALPPQVLREITHEGSLHVCEGCGVLIYAASETELAPTGVARE